MVLHKETGEIEHRLFKDIIEYFGKGDTFVLNDTKVFPARLIGTWEDTPGEVEVLMVSPAPVDGSERPVMTEDGLDSLVWNCILGSGRKCRAGQTAVFGPARELKVRLLKPLQGLGMWQVEFICTQPLAELLEAFGRTPVPPYVKRAGTAEEERDDRARYQTIYARHVGSVAAPTAGLHFTPEIFAALEAKGVRRVSVTLHVGPGTFRPVKAERIEDHHMDFEAFTVPPETAEAINACRARGGRIVCVGSTTVRTLETVAAAHAGADGRLVVPGSGASDIFIYPPYEFKVCDAMLTNFHLPQSTLLMMVSALAGRERILASYALAIQKDYRFLSYGDCMLIL
jgi:S-adenosylmethionine:tRNA ribosyltransferase-isomerase